MDAPETLVLLKRWHDGDGVALNDLLDRDLPWIRKKVHHRLGPALRAKAETVDIVQDAMVELLKYGPRFVMSDREQFRGLVAKIVENVLRGKHDWFAAQRRQMAREKPLPSDTILRLDTGEREVETPSVIAANQEREARLRLAFELLEPEDREVVLLRNWKQLSFAEIGAELGIDADAARMRFNRTLPKLAERMAQIEAADVDGLIAGS